ncbi:MAG: hypothetical protein UR30_C0007G0033 [Candidatus Peregrinibacteria bacterium GW2011_GWC2_33_13]|nr:MAG: hypothetical protein UR30_C0007G0033 [Candidatus Peregrinibacteria bacterium GW2011_GWC2_33_13]
MYLLSNVKKDLIFQVKSLYVVTKYFLILLLWI